MAFFSNWINCYIENPIKTWWKARKYFKRPKMYFHFFLDPIFNCPYVSLNSIAKVLDISVCDVQWKDKFNSPRFERSPYVWICFFRRFGFSIDFHIFYNGYLNKRTNGDMEYWEYLLNYVYYNKTLDDGYNQWENMNGYVIPTKQFSLNGKYL